MSTTVTADAALNLDKPISDVLYRAADLVAGHGLFAGDYWPRSGAPWDGRSPLDITAAIGIARGYTTGLQMARLVAATDIHPEELDPAVFEFIAHIGLDTARELFAWSDARADEAAAERVAGILRELAADIRAREATS